MKSYRPERVGNVIRTVVSDAITNRLNDPRIEPLSSVTRVEVTSDLEYAKVWVSVMGSESTQRRTIAGLRSAAGYMQKMVAGELSIRIVPRLSFHLDQSIKRGEETLRLIERVMAESRAGDSPAEGDEQADDSDDQSSRAPQ